MIPAATLTAGHCSENTSLLNVAQFNVPPSDVVGNPSTPIPFIRRDRYAKHPKFAGPSDAASAIPIQSQAIPKGHGLIGPPQHNRRINVRCIIGMAPWMHRSALDKKRPEGLFLFSFAYSLSHNCDTMGGDSVIIDATTGDVLDSHQRRLHQQRRVQHVCGCDLSLQSSRSVPRPTLSFRWWSLSRIDGLCLRRPRCSSGPRCGGGLNTLVDLGDGVVRAAAFQPLPCGASGRLHGEATDLPEPALLCGQR